MKVVINKCFGGFSLSKEACDFLGLDWNEDRQAYRDDDRRTDTKLIECVETLGYKASGTFAALKIVEVPDDVNWEIDSYDGVETIHEVHRVWE